MTAKSAKSTRRIAMWSGPRNISTAMMRAWENRPDCEVADEPLYGAFLAKTGIDHPGRDDILGDMETDWRKVVDMLTTQSPGQAPLFYQKHMTHHLLPDMDLSWVLALENVFLIRNPSDVIQSYVKKRQDVTLSDLGLEVQVTLFERIQNETGKTPPVIDGRRILEDPEGVLSALCDTLDIPFTKAMLNWPSGPRDSDGIWARWWYDAVEKSTGFGPPPAEKPPLEGTLADLAERCLPYYETLLAHHIKI